ncbi:MAG: hypothetical protein JOY86_08355, partial [Candidatus Eremiobacteraeota bacterium]|nr:hypothetical protein [Candidatus Eremiobacteraeota bacterium]
WMAIHVLPFFRDWPHSTLIANTLPFVAALLVGIAATYLIERPFLDHGWAVLGFGNKRKATAAVPPKASAEVKT